MWRVPICSLLLFFLPGLGCAFRGTIPGGNAPSSDQSSTQTRLLAYDQKEEHFHVLYHQLREKWEGDPQLIEAWELASVAEEFYLLAEYETAMEVLQQAILLLEEKRGGEQKQP